MKKAIAGAVLLLAIGAFAYKAGPKPTGGPPTPICPPSCPADAR